MSSKRNGKSRPVKFAGRPGAKFKSTSVSLRLRERMSSTAWSAGSFVVVVVGGVEGVSSPSVVAGRVSVVERGTEEGEEAVVEVEEVVEGGEAEVALSAAARRAGRRRRSMAQGAGGQLIPASQGAVCELRLRGAGRRRAGGPWGGVCWSEERGGEDGQWKEGRGEWGKGGLKISWGPSRLPFPSPPQMMTLRSPPIAPIWGR